MNTKITTPILFLVFNRPEHTQKVFDVIKRVKPTKLYVAADAPRKNIKSDEERCFKVKKIVTQIDWECDVKYLFHDNNQGCSLAGFKAWDWFFSHEEKMIFIEDDGLVSDSFFFFCQELLNKYQNDKRIAYIYSDNFGRKFGEASYFFSKFGSGTYGMATWKRVFDLYEYDLKSYNQTKNNPVFKKYFVHKFDYDLTNQMFKSFLKKRSNTYDLQMVYLIHKYNMLNIVPNLNLVSNIGYDVDGSNTNVSPESEIAKKFGNRPKFELDTISHPEKVFVDRIFEKEYFKVRVLNDEPIFYSIIKFYSKKYLGPVYRKTLRKLIT